MSNITSLRNLRLAASSRVSSPMLPGVAMFGLYIANATAPQGLDWLCDRIAPA
jgi:hypothetical protein